MSQSLIQNLILIIFEKLVRVGADLAKILLAKVIFTEIDSITKTENLNFSHW